jgi:short-subunit dehydrogenase
MDEFRGRHAVITGGSTGIGAAFARQLAQAGAELTLIARSRTKLQALSAQLRAEHGVEVRVIAEDLTSAGAPERVAQAVLAARAPDLLVNNAGFASYGRFAEQPLARQLEEVQLNVTSLVELTWRFLPGLVERKGGLIQVASTAAFQAVPYMAVYGATKAFVLSFTEAIWAEYRERGLKVLALCPGATDTPFFDRVEAPEASVGAKADPAEVAALGLRALRGGGPTVVHGLTNTLGSLAPRFVTRARATLITERLMRPRPPSELPATGSSR